MDFHRAFGHVQLARDFLVAQPLRQASHGFAFARRQFVVVGLGRVLPRAELRHQLGRHGVGNHGLTGGGAADGLAQLLGFYIFQQVATCARAQGRAQVGRVFGHRQHQHHHLRHVLQDQLQRFDARYAGHVQVHQHHVGQ